MNAQNTSPIAYALMAFISYLIYRFFVAIDASDFYLYLFGGVALINGLLVIKGLINAFTYWRMTKDLFKPAGTYGAVNPVTAKDVESLGLKFSNEDGNGIPLGADGENIIYWDGKGHMSVRAPTEGGKTASSASLICFALGKHRNIIATAKSEELALLCGQYRESLGQNIIYIDPYRLMKKHGITSHDFNPVGYLVRFADQGDDKLFDKAMGFAYSALPDPENNNSDPIFKSQGRAILSTILGYLAYLESSTGELCCNLPYLRRIIGGSQDSLLKLLNDMKFETAFDGAFAIGAGRLLSLFQHGKKSAMSFLIEAQDALQIYATGALSRNTEYSDFNVYDLKNKDTPTSVFIILPADLMISHGKFAGHCLNAMIDVCMMSESFLPRTTIIADEFASLGVVASIVPLIFQGRSYGIQLISYVQDSSSYSLYGKNASIFDTNSEIIMAWGIRSTKDAEQYSKKAGQLSIIAPTNNMPFELDASNKDKTTQGLAEKGIAHFRSDEFLHMPQYQAALFYKNNPCLMIDLVSYQMVDPWVHQAGIVPNAPKGDKLPIKYKA